MLDSQLIILISGEILKALQMGFPAFGPTEIAQKAQPTNEGVPSDPTVFFEKLFDLPRHWPIIGFQKSTPEVDFSESAKQLYETTFQISALRWQDPESLVVYTASDLLNYVYMYFQLKSVRDGLIKQGVNVLKVNEIRNPYFQNDRHQFEAHPSVDIVFTHMRTMEILIPAITSATGESYPLVE